MYEQMLTVESRAITHFCIGSGQLKRLKKATGDARVFAVVDDQVLCLHRRVIKKTLMEKKILATTIKAEESSKTRELAAQLQDALFAARVERDDVVLAIGGGFTSDLVGFAVATCLRGIRFIVVPTTLLAMIDAAIGGKTAVNTRAGKNLVGTFHWPMLVIADTDFLKTLSLKEMRQGLAEMVKHAVIGGEGLFKKIEQEAENLAIGQPPSDELLAEAAAVKIAVVSRDPFEHGERRTLNFGHTVGHAIEAASDFEVRHGDAVAAGMVVEMRVASRLLGFPAEDEQRVQRLLNNLGLPVKPQCPFAKVASFLLSDKKVKKGTVRMALPRRIGEMEEGDGSWAVEVGLNDIEGFWDA